MSAAGQTKTKVSVTLTELDVKQADSKRKIAQKAPKMNESSTKTRQGLRLVTDKVKALGGTTPCSSPSDGAMIGKNGPNWDAIQSKVSDKLKQELKLK